MEAVLPRAVTQHTHQGGRKQSRRIMEKKVDFLLWGWGANKQKTVSYRRSVAVG